MNTPISHSLGRSIHQVLDGIEDSCELIERPRDERGYPTWLGNLPDRGAFIYVAGSADDLHIAAFQVQLLGDTTAIMQRFTLLLRFALNVLPELDPETVMEGVLRIVKNPLHREQLRTATGWATIKCVLAPEPAVRVTILPPKPARALHLELNL